jgi:hypothetical protein
MQPKNERDQTLEILPGRCAITLTHFLAWKPNQESYDSLSRLFKDYKHAKEELKEQLRKTFNWLVRVFPEEDQKEPPEASWIEETKKAIQEIAQNTWR